MSIRILTANLFGGRADADALVELIERLRVDVACVQELSPQLADAISQVLPEGRLGSDRWAKNRGLGIACRRRAEIDHFPLPKRDGWTARLSPEDWDQLQAPVEIVNVHIIAPHALPYFPRRATRRGQLAHLLRFLDREPHVPRAILGDFNASPIWPLYRRLASRLTDAAAAVATENSGPRPTWPHLPILGIRGLIRIDHCFLSGLSALSVQVVPIRGSDHLGLCVDVGEPEQAGSGAQATQ